MAARTCRARASFARRILLSAGLTSADTGDPGGTGYVEGSGHDNAHRGNRGGLSGSRAGLYGPDQQEPPREGVAALQSGARLETARFIEGGTYTVRARLLAGDRPDPRRLARAPHPADRGRESPSTARNLPTSLHPDLRGSYVALNSSLPARPVRGGPFASQWWPQNKNGIADRWNSTVKDYGDLTSDPDNLSPAEKYDLLFYAGQGRSLGSARGRNRARGGPGRGAAGSPGDAGGGADVPTGSSRTTACIKGVDPGVLVGTLQRLGGLRRRRGRRAARSTTSA